MSGLPEAIPRSPDCGACGAETTSDDDSHVCYDCQLSFDGYTLEADFLDFDAEGCGAVCDNQWHRPNAIKPGQGFACHPCQLPAAHTSPHWTGCEPIVLRRGAS